ncbi:MAG: sigma-54 dependent transcriptional regulator [Pseudomonadota bacterium]
MTVSPDVIFVDDEEHLRISAAQTFELAGLSAQCFGNAADALEQVSRSYAGVVVSDIRMPNMDGSELLHRLLEIDFELPVLLVTGHGDVKLAVSSMQQGAYDFIEKPFAPDYLVASVRRALEKRRLTLENRHLRTKVTQRDKLETRLTGRTPVMIALRKAIRSIASTDLDVQITGETGVGKEVVARALHDLSPRADGPFVAINCGALSLDQVESELFGHHAGAFAGAIRTRIGKLEHGRRGTIFLDEIESMPLDLQVKLLRVLEERSITPLGSNEVVELDVRFLSASKENLQMAVEKGTFRQDLYFRLTTSMLNIPSLRERRDDIPRLFIQLANEAARRYRREFADIPSHYLLELSNRDWPGNVRELRNEADRFVLGVDKVDEDTAEQATLAQRMAAHERAIVSSELSAHNGVLKETYEALGISRKSLYEKMQKHGLNRRGFMEDDSSAS